MHTRAFLLLLTLFALGAHAAEPATVLRAARLFDVRAGRLVTPGVVVVQDGRIVGVGAQARVPAGARVVDLGDATLLPGFMDAHTHLSGEPGSDWRQDVLDELGRSVAERALDTPELARRTLLAGFTTVRNLGAEDGIDVALRNAVARGRVVGPRMLVSGAALGTTGGHCDGGNGFAQGALAHDTSPGVADGPDALRLKVRERVKYGADLIKVCATGGVLSQNADVDSPQLTQAELDALVDEAHARKRRVAAHAHGAEGAKRAVRAGVDSIEHGSFLDDETLQLMKQRGTWFVPTIMAFESVKERLAQGKLSPDQAAKVRAVAPVQQATLRKAVAAGLKIALGTDAGVFAHGRNAGEFRLLVDAGLTPAQALRAGTLSTAELFGVEDRLGTLEAGKLADVVAVPGDVLRDVRATERVFFVMKEGVVYRNDRAAPAPAVLPAR